MTIVLTQETETRLRERAARSGRDANEYAEALLDDALRDDPDDLTDDEIAEIRAGVRRSLEAAAGSERPLTEYMADVQARRAA